MSAASTPQQRTFSRQEPSTKHASAVPKPLNANRLMTLPISDYVNEFMTLNKDEIWD